MRLAILLGLGLAACATGPSLEAAMATYDTRAEACRTAHPFEPIPDSERRWAPGEAAYRDCLRDAFEQEVVPALPYAELRVGYRALLDEDRRLADEVAQGRLSRGEYREKLDAAIARLAAARREQAEADRRARTNAAEVDSLQRQLNTIDDLIRRGRF